MSNQAARTIKDLIASPADVVRRPVFFSSGEETLAGDLILPTEIGPHPALLNIAGTGAQNRYGDPVAPTGEVTAHGRDLWVSNRLAQTGIASLCWDKRGVGESTGGNRKPGDPPGERDSYATVMTDVQDAESALTFLANQPEIDPKRIAVMGHSAGVFFACLLASHSNVPAAYILWAGVHMAIEDLEEYIYGQVLEYAGRGAEQEEWVRRHSLPTYRLSKHQRQFLSAAQSGQDVYVFEDDKVTIRHYITRLKQELQYPLHEQFQHVKRPALVIHGDQDYNVGHSEAFKIARELRDAGNHTVTLVIVPGADHSMHIAPAGMSDEQRLRERLSRGSYFHPYSEFFIHSLIGWLKDRLLVICAAD